MITFLYAGLLGLLLFYISLETIKGRRKHLISLGAGQNNEIEQLVAAHSNFASYTPTLLILLALAEMSGRTHPYAIHILGLMILSGRVFHFTAFRNKMNFTHRKLGMYLTLWPLLGLALWNIVLYCKVI